MTTIFAATNDQVLIATVLPKIAQGNINLVRLHVDFDSTWDEVNTKVAVFTTSNNPRPYQVIFSGEGDCLIPPEVLAEDCKLYITIKGFYFSDGLEKSTTKLTVKVLSGAPIMFLSEPTEDVYRQLMRANSKMNGAIAAERARVDNLINSGEGSAGTAENELADLRVDVNGKAHGSAGSAVRAQIEVVNNDQRIGNENGKTTFASHANWQVGGMTSAQITAHRNRIMSLNVLYFERNIKINIAEGFKIGVHTVTADGTFVADSNWRTGEYEVSAFTYFKIVVARVTEDSAETADVAEFSAAVTFDTYASHKIAVIDGTVKQHSNLFNLIANGKTVDVVGAYYTTGGSGLPNNRIHAADIVCDGLAVLTFCDTTKEYFYGVDLYTNDGRRAQISTSGWMRTSERPSFVVSQNCVMDISISKLDMTSFDDLSEMNGLFNLAMYETLASVKEETSALGGRKKCWLTSAHRGFVDSVLKENSLAAYYNAYLNGADMIETDAWLSSDGVLIVNHDATVTAQNESGQTVTYTIAETPSSVLCSLILSNDEKWGVQKVPTLEQVLNLAYHTGLTVNIDMKNGFASVKDVVNLVVKCGMSGRVIYALNGSGMTGINTILAKDPEAKFIDSAGGFVNAVANYADRRTRCYAYTSDLSAETVKAIRDGGCMVALISLNANNFETAISLHPDMCEYLHTSNFKTIENDYFKNAKLY